MTASFSLYKRRLMKDLVYFSVNKDLNKYSAQRSPFYIRYHFLILNEALNDLYQKLMHNLHTDNSGTGGTNLNVLGPSPDAINQK